MRSRTPFVQLLLASISHSSSFAIASKASRQQHLAFLTPSLALGSLRALSLSATLAIAAATRKEEASTASTSSTCRSFSTGPLYSTNNNDMANPSTSPPSSSSTSPSSSSWRQRITLLTQKEAQAIDEELMSSPGFSVDQLMELAGLSVSQAVDNFLQQSTRSASVLILCGPGNNGGDGLVAARHLFHFGYRPVVVYPKRSSKPLFLNLVKQCEDLGVEVGEELPGDIEGRFDCIIDALFGFGTTGALRPPFDSMVQRLTGVVVVAVAVLPKRNNSLPLHNTILFFFGLA